MASRRISCYACPIFPSRPTYDIEKLGLTVGAAEKLLKRKVDPLIVSQLIVSPPFALLVTQLARLRDDTYAAGFAYMTEMLRGMNDLFTEHVQSNPDNRQAAKKVMEDLRLLRAAPYQVQTETLHETLDKIVEDFKKGSDSYMQEMQKLTSKVMAKITSNLKAQMKNPEKLRGITPEMMVDSLIGAMDHLELNDEQKKQFRETLLPLFTQPQDMMRE